MKLTQTVKKGGCAAKVPAVILREILNGLTFPPRIPGVEIDGAEFDDAAIYNINDDVSLVQTLDFFTPIVDSPRDFGAVAAANALSDVYAMGGTPKTCMAILAAPLATMEPAIIQEVLQGACEVITEAGASLVGGHSIDDDTLKFGLSVTGVVNPKNVWSNRGAKAGDVLILTKALGTGTICAGIKQGKYSEQDAAEAIASMKQLNSVVNLLAASEVNAIHAATDITGFGLAGHSYQLARASEVSLELSHGKLPVLKLAYGSLAEGLLTKAHRSNREYTQDKFIQAESIGETEKLIHFDPQTSGGLLLSVDADAAPSLLARIQSHFPQAAIIGTVKPKSRTYVHIQ